MFAEKSWGLYRVLDVSDRSMTVEVTLNPGHGMNYHSHERRDEEWTVVSGSGRVVIDGVAREVKAGDVIDLPVGSFLLILWFSLRMRKSITYLSYQSRRSAMDPAIISTGINGLFTIVSSIISSRKPSAAETTVSIEQMLDMQNELMSIQKRGIRNIKQNWLKETVWLDIRKTTLQ